MKFTLIKEVHSEPLMVRVLMGLGVFALLYLGADVLHTAQTLGLDYDAVAVALHGDPQLYADPMEPAALLELWHGSLFFAMMLMLTLSALFGRLCKSDRLRILMVNLLGVGAVSAHLALPAAYYWDERFVLVWLAGFWCWHLIGAAMCAVSLRYLVRP